MTNTQEPGNLLSDASAVTMTSMVSNLDETQQGINDYAVYRTFQNHLRSVSEPNVSLVAASGSNKGNSSSNQTSPPDLRPIRPQLLDHPLLCDGYRNNAQKKVRRVYSFELEYPLILAPDDAFFYEFQIWSEENRKSI